MGSSSSVIKVDGNKKRNEKRLIKKYACISSVISPNLPVRCLCTLQYLYQIDLKYDQLESVLCIMITFAPRKKSTRKKLEHKINNTFCCTMFVSKNLQNIGLFLCG